MLKTFCIFIALIPTAWPLTLNKGQPTTLNINNSDPGVFPSEAYKINLNFGCNRGTYELVRGDPKLQKVRYGKSVETAMNITLEQAYTGFSFDAFWKKQQLCPHCNGKGGKVMKICSKCKGHGTLNSNNVLNHFHHHHHRHHTCDRYENSNNEGMNNEPAFVQEQFLRCTTCNGRGEVPHQGAECPHCKGLGVVEVKKNMKLSLPPGVPNNQKISLEGEGHENRNLKPGMLVLKVVVLPHKVFQRDGKDLHVQLNMSIKEAKNGFQRNITHLNGTTFVIVREGITPPGLRLRVFHAGMPCYNGKRTFRDEKARANKTGGEDTSETNDNSGIKCYGDMIISFTLKIPPHIKKHIPSIFEDFLSTGNAATNSIENASYLIFD